jgi:hypothetical protein
VTSFTDNPFAALTIVVAPAILTNASSILCLGTASRLALVVDRTRVVSEQLARLAPTGEHRVIYERQLGGLEVRSNLVLLALRFFYISLGSFATAALISLFGSAPTVSARQVTSTAIAFLGLLSGTVGVAGLVAGCALMVQETRLAVRNLAEEAQLSVHPIENP